LWSATERKTPRQCSRIKKLPAGWGGKAEYRRSPASESLAGKRENPKVPSGEGEQGFVPIGDDRQVWWGKVGTANLEGGEKEGGARSAITKKGERITVSTVKEGW